MEISRTPPQVHGSRIFRHRTVRGEKWKKKLNLTKTNIFFTANCPAAKNPRTTTPTLVTQYGFQVDTDNSISSSR